MELEKYMQMLINKEWINICIIHNHYKLLCHNKIPGIYKLDNVNVSSYRSELISP